MITSTPTYLEVISENFPNLIVSALGDGSVYETLVPEQGSTLPTKAELDTLILNTTKSRMWKLIQAERDRRKWNGVKIGSDWFHSDDTSRIQQLALVMMGAGMPGGIMWKTLGGSFVLMSPTLAAQIFQATGAQDMAIFSKAEHHKALMNASQTPSTYDYTTGWPVTFGE